MRCPRLSLPAACRVRTPDAIGFWQISEVRLESGMRGKAKSGHFELRRCGQLSSHMSELRSLRQILFLQGLNR